MNQTSWVLLDTETNGLQAPIYAVEIGAQMMRGWKPEGPPFRRLLNHNADISPGASRVNGYTREILERDGVPPLQVYKDFAAYIRNLPLVSYNLRFDLDDVLLPEWQRLDIAPIGRRGFCALELARRLLDPVPAGNCKLQTLRQYYRLPGRGAHTALGDVETVVDLMDAVLRPLAEVRGLTSWESLMALTEEQWFPSLIGFGKFKGRNFREATKDAALLNWLNWLARSSNGRSASMGRWYLEQLSAASSSRATVGIPPSAMDSSPTKGGAGVVLYLAPQLGELQLLIASARNRLVELEAQFTEQKHGVDVTLAQLFKALKTHYQRRDRLRLVINHRRKYLEVLMQEGDDGAAQVTKAHDQARQRSDIEYEEAAAQAATKAALTDDQSKEMKEIWRKLVKAYHPDRCADDPALRLAHEWLTAEINKARDQGNIERLREISKNPNAFLAQHGMAPISQDDLTDADRLQTLFDSLQQRILETLEALNNLHESSGYQLYERTGADANFLESTVAAHMRALDSEIAAMQFEADGLELEIEQLTGVVGPG